MLLIVNVFNAGGKTISTMDPLNSLKNFTYWTVFGKCILLMSISEQIAIDSRESGNVKSFKDSLNFFENGE